jgi:hypothetical protein
VARPLPALLLVALLAVCGCSGLNEKNGNGRSSGDAPEISAQSGS